MKITLIALLGTLALSGCTFQSAVSATPVYDVYSGYDDKMPGTWALHVSDLGRFAGEAEMASYACAAHNYPIDVGQAFNSSLTATITNLVEDLQIVDRTLTASELREREFAGIILVKAERVDAELIVNPGFWSGKPRSEVELTASLVVEGLHGRLMGTTISGDGTGRTSGGCAQGADVVKTAAEESIRDLLTVLGERFANSPRIRDYSQ